MTHIVGIRLRNFKRYRGDFPLDLQPTCYAVTAQRDGDVRRSNYQGKSTFLWAIRFALTGDAATKVEDDWITWGEREAGVDMELSDGTYIERTRVRGDRTGLMIKRPNPDGTERELLDDEAQLELNTLVGGTPDEHLATWWSGQKQTDFFTTADASELTALVTEWVGLARVRHAFLLAQKEHRTLKASNDGDVANEARELATRTELGTLEGLRDELALAEANLRATEALIAQDSKLTSENIRRDALQQDADSYRSYGQAIEQYEAAVATREPLADLEVATKRLAAKLEAQRVASQALTAARTLAKGQFGGKCPVNGCACPVKDAINADMTVAHQRLTTAEETHKKAVSAYETEKRQVQELRTATDARAKEDREYEEWKRLRARLKPRADEHARLTEPPAAAGTLDTATMLTRDRQLMREAERKVAAWAVADKRLKEAQQRLAENRPYLIALREAVQLLGPAGIQRRMARTMLDEIEELAAEMLAACEVDLEVTFEWERDTKQPAEACEVCGAAFPPSRKVRHCPECGADRGMKKEQRLRVVVEPKSGGADNMAGLVGRLAVAWWLRTKRSSDWGVLCLDEPLGEFDEYTRRVVVQRLQQLALMAGFTQVFLVAHSREASDSMPARVHITGGLRGSKISVQHGSEEAGAT